jgi:hypothetical protein
MRVATQDNGLNSFFDQFGGNRLRVVRL